jgi:hypothetical protein
MKVLNDRGIDAAELRREITTSLVAGPQPVPAVRASILAASFG